MKMLQIPETGDEVIFFSRDKHMLLTHKDADLYIKYMSLFRSDEHFVKPKVLPGIMFHIVYEGSGVIEYNDKRYRIDKNKMALFWPESRVKYCSNPRNPWWFLWFWLAGTKAQWVLKQIGFSQQVPVYDIADCSNLLACINDVAKTFREGTYSPFFSTLAAWRICDALSVDFSTYFKSSNVDSIADKCRVLIENDPASFSSVNDLAEMFNLDRTTLFRLFKASFHVSPKEFIDSVRLEKACQLLSTTEMKIKEVSEACGYQNQCYFSYAFQKHFALSPSQWRSSMQPTK